MAILAIGFLISVLTAHFFWTVLQGPVTNNYNLAVVLNIFVLSGFGALVFGVLLLIALWQWFRQKGLPLRLSASAWASRPEPKPTPSEFSRRWRIRKNLSYEDNRRFSRETGDQAAYRLKCEAPAQNGDRGLWPRMKNQKQ